jgi:hypothetical protein
MNLRQRKTHSGAALVTAIIFASIFTIIVGGLALYAVGSYSLAKKGTEYAAAVQLADAGVNSEFRNIALNQFNNGYTAPTAASPHTGSISGVPGTYSVYITADAAGSQNWDPSKKDLYMWSSGTVAGVTRKIMIHGMGGDGLFDTYAVYGTNSVTFNGVGSSVVGNLGTNGTVSSTSNGSAAVTGTLFLNGSSATGVTGSNVVKNPDPITFPTVDSIMDATFPGHGDTEQWLASHNNNGQIRQFVSSSNQTLSPSATQNLTGQAITALSHTKINSLPGKTIILPATNAPNPTDYVFTDITTSGQDKIIVDNGGLTTGGTPGLVRIWMFGSTGGDNVSQPISYTATIPAVPDPAQLFRLYYDKNATFQIDGNTASGGAIYAINEYASSGFTITGGSSTFASILANNVTISGNSSVQFPGQLPGNSTDFFWLWFGFKDGYQEVPYVSGRSVFPDGTSN